MLNEHLEAMCDVLKSIEKLPRMRLVITQEFQAILERHFVERNDRLINKEGRKGVLGDIQDLTYSGNDIYGIPVVVEKNPAMWSEVYYGRLEVLLPNGEVDWNKVTWIAK